MSSASTTAWPADAGRAAYALRKQTVEPRFGHIKHGLGVRRLLHRGLDKVGTEWRLVCPAVNIGILLALQRHERRRAKVGFSESPGRIGAFERPARVGANGLKTGANAIPSRGCEGAVGDGTPRIGFRSLTVAARKRTRRRVVVLKRSEERLATALQVRP